MTSDITHPRSVFDELTGAGAPAADPPMTGPGPDPDGPAGPEHPAGFGGPATPAGVKQALQELLRLGVLYAEAKPNLFQSALANRAAMAAILEPLDLALRVDEVRGMVILVVAPSLRDEGNGLGAGGDELMVGGAGSGGDEWHHPLVRRQRLTLAQSLLLAILRRRYVEHEKMANGATAARVPVDELTSELGTYLGDEGSDSANESRLRRLLEQLREHGIVSAVDDNDEVSIRPLICHVADPTSLQLLLHHYSRLAGGPAPGADDPGPNGEEGSHR